MIDVLSLPLLKGEVQNLTGRYRSAVLSRGRLGCDSRGLPNTPARPQPEIQYSAATSRSSRNKDAAPPAAPDRHALALMVCPTSYARARRRWRQNPPAEDWWCSRHGNAATRT